MNFTEAVDAVLAEVKRPDKIATIRREVNAAINFCSVEGNFAFDRTEQTVAIDATVYAQSILLSTFIRFRKIDCIRPPTRRCYITHLDPSKIFNKGEEELDKYYIAGTQINFKLSQLSSSLLVAYFSYPPILTDTAGNNTFWMLDMSPFMIIDKACASVFTSIGDNKSAADHMNKFGIAFTSAKRDYKYGANYG